MKDTERLFWLAANQLKRRGFDLTAASWMNDRELLAIPGFGRAKLKGWRSVFYDPYATRRLKTPQIEPVKGRLAQIAVHQAHARYGQ